MAYYEIVRIYDKLPRSIREKDADRDHGDPRKLFVEWGEVCTTVSRIRSMLPTNSELFPLGFIFMNPPFDFFDEPKRCGDHHFQSYREAAIAEGLQIHRNEHETAIIEAIRYYPVPSELMRMVVTFYQQDMNPEALIERHRRVLMADLRGSSTVERRKEMVKRIIQISGRHGCRLIKKLSYFSQFARQPRVE
eukprot:gb/GEZJ01005415.1/.p1 GENE.gb/GEZJ01005415.1/~~gb/GEZJ01005415.1/.p1  ORF type:complete len:192 (-),score=24.14 gb/GEZJ01005415.1/:1463-2038(-)